MKYKIIDISTLNGLRQAERLKTKGENQTESGYTIVSVGLDKLRFSIPEKSTKTK